MALSRAVLFAAWVGAIALVLVAYGVIVLPEQRALGALKAEAAQLYETADRNEDIISNEPRVRLARRRIREELLGIGSQSLSAVTGSLLEALERAGNSLRVRVLSVSPVLTAGNQSAVPKSLAVGDIGIEIEGTFPAILALVADVRTGGRLVGIDTVELSNVENGGAGEPVLHAVIGARLYTLTANWEGRLAVALPSVTR